MSNTRQKPVRKGPWIIAVIVAVVVVAMGTIGTTYLTPGEVKQATATGKDPQAFAEKNYDSVVVAGITDNATDLTTVAKALDDDQAAAADEYGVGDPPTTTYSVSFTGEVTDYDEESGNLSVDVDGMPEGSQAAVQTGNPGVIGTALRDATGKVTFPMFTNQLDFQKVGSVLNQIMKKKVLDPLDVPDLVGKKISVVGATQPATAKLIVVTPVTLEVQS